MLLCTKIRLPVSEADAAALEVMPGQCRGRYNWWVLRLRDGGERGRRGTAAGAAREARQGPDPERPPGYGQLVRDLGSKTRATGLHERSRVYHIGGFNGPPWDTRHLDTMRAKRGRCRTHSRRSIHWSPVYQRVSERQRAKQRDCLHKASQL